MTNTTHTYDDRFFQSLPKVELHRHLEGSVRVRTLVDVAKTIGMDVTGTGSLRPLVQIGENEPYTFENFLSKFATLRLFYKSPDIISRITREAIEDAAAENIRYMELRFTPVALSRAEGFPMADVMDWVIHGAEEASKQNNIKVQLIASFNRHESLELAEEVTQLAVDRLGKGIIGLDIAGNEAEYPLKPFRGLLVEAKRAGLKLTVHAGEWAGAENVIEAIEEVNADRIGHGVRVIESSRAVGVARERNIPFEVCVTSNYQSGVVPSLDEHPLKRMMAAGLNVTINTDDPSVSGINLTHEYKLVCGTLGLPLTTLRERVLSAAQAGFLPVGEKEKLLKELREDFAAFI